MQYKEVSDKYKNAYGEIELYDNHSAIWTPILYCLRRFALAFVCVCFDGHPFWQFAFLFVWQTVNLIYLGEVRPYETRSQYHLAMGNECLIFVLVYHLITFSDEYIRLEEGRRMSGYSMIVCTLFALAVNLAILAYNEGNEKIRTCRINWYKR